MEDVPAHLAGEDEEQARRFGWYPARSTEDTVRRAFERWQSDWCDGGPTRAFAIRDATSGELAGGCEIRLHDDEIAHLSYWIFPAFRSQGLASRAIKLACDWAFDALGVERMEVYVEPDNLASRRAAERAGFQQEGILRRHTRFGQERRDMVLYARLPE